MITDIKVLDNFYRDPSFIDKFLTNGFPVTGCGAGARTLDLSLIDINAYNELKVYLCQLHGCDPSKIDFVTYFMGHDYSEIDDIFNQSTIHIDGKDPNICLNAVSDYKLEFCGQILLTPNPNPDGSVTIHKFKSHIDWDEKEIVKRCIDEYTLPGEYYRAGKISLEEFKEMRNKHDSNFDLTCEIKNVYNRMVSWKGGTLHAQKFRSPRVLNQYFFAAAL
jgi:hypothetical protein